MSIEIEQTNQSKRKKRSSQTSKSSKKASVDEIVSWFAACGRCSFFLTGYQLLDGVDDLATAVGGSEPGWLSLTWNQGLCNLVNESYGCRVDIECYYLDGTCPECQRHFVFRAIDEDNESPDFRIEAVPRSRRR